MCIPKRFEYIYVHNKYTFYCLITAQKPWVHSSEEASSLAWRNSIMTEGKSRVRWNVHQAWFNILVNIEFSTSFLIGRKRTVNFRNQSLFPWPAVRKRYSGQIQKCHILLAVEKRFHFLPFSNSKLLLEFYLYDIEDDLEINLFTTYHFFLTAFWISEICLVIFYCPQWLGMCLYSCVLSREWEVSAFMARWTPDVFVNSWPPPFTHAQLLNQDRSFLVLVLDYSRTSRVRSAGGGSGKEIGYWLFNLENLKIYIFELWNGHEMTIGLNYSR